MDAAYSIAQTREKVAAARRDGRSVGLVPTMGALHAGHISLIREARARLGEHGFVVVSVFVNPTQFGPGEDFARYPRPIEDDLELCRQHGADLVFHPPVSEMYPQPGMTKVHVQGLTAGLCGAIRPGHFDGVTTVVAKLLNIVGPDAAFFGEKDYQQLVAVRRMVRDLDMPVEIVACPTVREADGLAMSSRNRYLEPEQRRQAAVLYRAMRRAVEASAAGRVDAAALIAGIESDIRESGPAVIEYVKIVDAERLEELPRVDRPARVCLAVRIGACRLIDNLAVGVDARGRMTASEHGGG